MCMNGFLSILRDNRKLFIKDFLKKYNNSMFDNLKHNEMF